MEEKVWPAKWKKIFNLQNGGKGLTCKVEEKVNQQSGEKCLTGKWKKRFNLQNGGKGLTCKVEEKN